jgi:chromosome segregation ATPase
VQKAMTPAERLTRIENLLQTITQLQARHDEAIAQHDEAIAAHDKAIAAHDNAVAAHNEAGARQDAQIEKQNAGIQDLIRVSRTLLDSETRAWNAIETLGATVDKLSDTVDRILESFQKPNGHE